MKIIELDQGSEEWYKWREIGIGSSEAAAIMGVSKYMTIEKLRRLKRGEIKQKKSNAASRRGKILEPVARELYHFLRGIKTRPVCVINDQYDWLKASLDGLSEDNKRVLEIKCVNKIYHQMALDGSVPPEYWPQVQHQLLVTDLEDLDYWSYSESSLFSKMQRVALVKVRPEKEYLERLFEAERKFCKDIGIIKD